MLIQASPDQPHIVQQMADPLLPVLDDELLDLLVPLALVDQNLVNRRTQE